MKLKDKIDRKIQAYANLFSTTYMNTKTEGAKEAWKKTKEVNN